MSDFTLSIHVSDIPYTFSFIYIKTPGAEKYFVRADNFSDMVSFELKKNYAGNWKVVEPAPPWIVDMEASFSEIINRQLNKEK